MKDICRKKRHDYRKCDLETVRLIVKELSVPSRLPRGTIESIRFRKGVPEGPLRTWRAKLRAGVNPFPAWEKHMARVLPTEVEDIIYDRLMVWLRSG